VTPLLHQARFHKSAGLRTLHVPLGKLHTERLLPADGDIRRIVDRILALRALAPPAWQNPKVPCCPVAAAIPLCTRPYSWPWRMPPGGLAAPLP